MKKTIIIISVIAGLAGFFIVTKQTKQNVVSSEIDTKTNYQGIKQNTNLRQATLDIDGMYCASCATGAEYAIKEKAGVIDAKIDYNNKGGTVVYDPSIISKSKIIEAVKPYTAIITNDKKYVR